MQFAYCSLYIAVCTLQSAYYSLLEFEFWIWNRMWNWIWNWIWNPILNLCGFNDQKSNLKLNVKLNLELNLELNLKSNLISFLNLKLKLKLALTFVWRRIGILFRILLSGLFAGTMLTNKLQWFSTDIYVIVRKLKYSLTNLLCRFWNIPGILEILN